MFVADEIAVSAGFGPAATRLLHVINHGVLHRASTAAYEEGLTAALRVGPFGEMRGASKLIRVQFLAPVRRGATMSVPLRWEAAGAVGDLFPVLDADLILVRDGDDRVRLGLSGSYRPPFGRAGAVLDRAVMKRVAAATIRSLLEGMAHSIADPAPEPQAAPRPAPTWLMRPEQTLRQPGTITSGPSCRRRRVLPRPGRARAAAPRYRGPGRTGRTTAGGTRSSTR